MKKMAVDSRPAPLNLRNQRNSSLDRKMDEYKEAEKKTDISGLGAPKPLISTAAAKENLNQAALQVDAIDDKLSKL